MTALTLRADEAAALWRDGAVVVRRPIGVPDALYPAAAEREEIALREWPSGPEWSVTRHFKHNAREHWRVPCPLGSPGERRWVREPHAIATGRAPDGLCAIRYLDRITSRRAVSGSDALPRMLSLADWRPAVTMPRWASRGDAVIASVEVEAEPWEWVVRVEVANG